MTTSDMSTRDYQKSAVYAAEQLVRRLLDRSGQFPTLQIAGSTITLPAEKVRGANLRQLLGPEGPSLQL